jgi:phage shock protein C
MPQAASLEATAKVINYSTASQQEEAQMTEASLRRLYRSQKNRMFAGVAGGLAEYFHIDPTLARIFLFLALLPTGPFGIVAYAILAAIIPPAPA